MTVRELYDFLAETMAENPQVKGWPVLVQVHGHDAVARCAASDHPDHSHPVVTVCDSYVC